MTRCHKSTQVVKSWYNLSQVFGSLSQLFTSGHNLFKLSQADSSHLKLAQILESHDLSITSCHNCSAVFLSSQKLSQLFQIVSIFF